MTRLGGFFSSHPRRIAASVGALTLTAALAVSGTGGPDVEVTVARWNDTEVTNTEIRAQWPDDGWARATTNAYTNHASYSARNNVRAEAVRQAQHNSSVAPSGSETAVLGDVNLD